MNYIHLLERVSLLEFDKESSLSTITLVKEIVEIVAVADKAWETDCIGVGRARQAGSDKTPEDLADQRKTHGKISPDNHSFDKSGPEGDLDCFHQSLTCSGIFLEKEDRI